MSATTSTIPITRLEAVNILLSAVGSAQVMSLQTADMNEEAQNALTTLSDTAREVQGWGWHFNTEESYPMEPNGDGHVNLPTNVAAITVGSESASKNLTQRGGKLYDLDEHTYAIHDTVYMDVIWLFEFQEMPPPIRWYVTALAGRKFGVGRQPESGIYKFTKEVEDDARAKALEFDIEARGVNLAQRSPHFRNMRRR